MRKVSYEELNFHNASVSAVARLMRSKARYPNFSGIIFRLLELPRTFQQEEYVISPAHSTWYDLELHFDMFLARIVFHPRENKLNIVSTCKLNLFCTKAKAINKVCFHPEQISSLLIFPLMLLFKIPHFIVPVKELEGTVIACGIEEVFVEWLASVS